ncbi:O-antigen ligase family protein [Clostridium sp.]|uniref:O-antigen ligase family protein n=1 Tax=Clostridium sp. TaxID=1506 RepID=UPI002608A9AE|nr:O-antigen ligase family protein [Clostridium sp.]
MLIIKSNKKSFKLIYGISSILLLFNIISSQSRNALIGLVIGLFLIAILYDKRFIIISIIFPIMLFIIPQSKLRILQIFDLTQNSSRYKIWEATKLMIKDHPILGIGYENFQIQYPIYVNNNIDTLLVSDTYLALHPHNLFLKFQSELGLLGTISLILFLVITIMTLINSTYKYNNKNESAILIGITSGFITLQFMNLIDNFYSAPKVIISMFIIIAIANNYRLSFNHK